MIYMTFLGGVFGPFIQEFSCIKGPKTPLEKVIYRSYFRRAQIRWVIWRSSNLITCLNWPEDYFFKVAICAKAFWPPKSPETTPNPKFCWKSSVAPKSPRNSHWIHTKRHTKPHWIPLSSPEFSRNFPNFPEIAQIPPNPRNFREIRGGEEFTQSAILR